MMMYMSSTECGQKCDLGLYNQTIKSGKNVILCILYFLNRMFQVKICTEIS